MVCYSLPGEGGEGGGRDDLQEAPPDPVCYSSVSGGPGEMELRSSLAVIVVQYFVKSRL